jgi:anti-anti-sigma factor
MEIEDFGIEVSYRDGLVVLAGQGDLDLVARPVPQTALDELGPTTDVILDCARTSFIDSSGINLLIEQSRRVDKICARLLPWKHRETGAAPTLVDDQELCALRASKART